MSLETIAFYSGTSMGAAAGSIGIGIGSLILLGTGFYFLFAGGVKVYDRYLEKKIPDYRAPNKIWEI